MKFKTGDYVYLGGLAYLVYKVNQEYTTKQVHVVHGILSREYEDTPITTYWLRHENDLLILGESSLNVILNNQKQKCNPRT